MMHRRSQQAGLSRCSWLAAYACLNFGTTSSNQIPLVTIRHMYAIKIPVPARNFNMGAADAESIVHGACRHYQQLPAC